MNRKRSQLLHGLILAALIAALVLPAPAALAQDARQAGAPMGGTQAEKDALIALQRAGYQVKEVQTTKAGIIARAVRDGQDVSLLVDSLGRIRERPRGQ